MIAVTEQTTTRDAEIGRGIQQLVVASGTNSADHGFHEDWPTLHKMPLATEVELHKQEIRRAIAEKIALIHEEISEALGEVRDGRDPLEIYYRDTKGLLGEINATYAEQEFNSQGIPMLKPEGFLVEIADMMIRGGDLAYLVDDKDGERLAFAQRIKHEYNATRPFKHGRKF